MDGLDRVQGQHVEVVSVEVSPAHDGVALLESGQRVGGGAIEVPGLEAALPVLGLEEPLAAQADLRLLDDRDFTAELEPARVGPLGLGVSRSGLVVALGDLGLAHRLVEGGLGAA